MENNGRQVQQNKSRVINLGNAGNSIFMKFYSVSVLIVIMVVWYFLAKKIDNNLLLPDFLLTCKEFFLSWVDPYTVQNLLITLERVFRGFIIACIIGLPLGLIMGYSKPILLAVSPIINSIRQVPIMAWIPLAIVWFGLGDGPTIFLITMSAIFPLIINTIDGVRGIDPNYINAARSMGARNIDIMFDIILPGALPSFLTGCRLALGLGWMSVICAEFIATSKGFGFILVEAQQRLETPKLYALMIVSAIIGFSMDRVLVVLEKILTSWRFKNGNS
ncbi:ABC transporter permease subunit SaoP [Brachyspira murdochii]|uniref:Binding-protein-dependent transport systems inner membrane component n=1 Tax=Brachyspira murdochii (strain ATCC 51284 / DSM 12563 / 56-150) TaxID=526224 RepID=D5U6C3_BRAM5|nr:ABC transporter permease subunit SaoP [Brachyspira murdochii]ADG72622.1 binding-protein-dependent transport systems inner membrane component [Brachyspira murdochii DSM 12563]